MLFAGIVTMPRPAAAEHFLPAPLEAEPPGEPPAPQGLLVASLGPSPDWLADEQWARASLQKPRPNEEGSALPVSQQDRATAAASPAGEAQGAESRPAPGSVPPGPGVVIRPEVRHFMDRFQSATLRGTVELWLARAGRYSSMIREVMLRKGLPEDLLFTAMMESGLDPLATSSAGAKGMWQFMASTARHYGLRVDPWLDERLDPEKSTVAAARYLRDLYGMFGSWHLAQAAYNAGETRVARAIQEVRTSDFWRLARTRHISDETKAFVAATQALAMIGREPGRYGFSAIPDEPLRYDIVSVPGGTTLASVARLAGIPAPSLSQLNPSLRLGQTPPGQVYPLKIPAGAGPRVAARVPGASKVMTANLRAPEQANGRSLPVIAAAGTQPATSQAQGLTQPNARPARTAAPASVHVVRPQDTLKDIARRYGVSVGDIIRWNQLAEADRIFPGDRLRVASLAPSARDRAEEEGEGGFR